MPIINAELGERIDTFAKRLSDAAKQSSQIRTGTFNGINITAAPTTSPEVLVQAFHDMQERSRQDYLKSPKHQEELRQAQIRLDALNAKAAILMKDFDSLNWDSLSDILDWLGNIQPVADHMYVTLDKDLIIQTFKDRGFLPNVNIDEDFRPEDKDNVARYIIGQALDGFIEVGAPHHMLNDFIAKWKKKFE